MTLCDDPPPKKNERLHRMNRVGQENFVNDEAMLVADIILNGTQRESEMLVTSDSSPIPDSKWYKAGQ